jgi:hypothetical protein
MLRWHSRAPHGWALSRLVLGAEPAVLDGFFLSLEEALLRTRIESQVMVPDDPERDAGVRQWRLGQVERCLAARGEMPPDTVFLNSGMHGPFALADQVLAALLMSVPSEVGGLL